MEDSKVISILAVSTNQDSATSLLNSCIPGLSTSDNQEWTTKEGEFTVKAYIKFPGTDIHRRGPNWLDLLVISVPEGDNSEREVLDYSSNRKDCKSRFLIESNTSRNVSYQNISVIDAGSFAGQLRDYATLLGNFNKENTDENEIDYHVHRQIFNIGDESNKVHKIDHLFDSYKRVFKVLNKISDMVKSFSGFDHSQGKSESTGKFNFAPENTESNGIGFLFDISVGEKYDQENTELPLIVRDNPLTASIELFSKSEEGTDSIISSLEILKEILANTGNMLAKLEKAGVTISFSKNKKSAFIDLTFGGLLGEAALNIFRGFNLESLKFSLTDSFRFQTGLNFKDVYENPDLDNIISKLATLTIRGDGTILNFRTLCHFFRELAKYVTSDDKKKKINVISYFGLIISAFESFGLELTYDSNDIKTTGMDIADGVLGGEGASKGMIEMGNDQLNNGIIPMVLGTIEGLKPMFEPFMPGLKELDIDKICVELITPGARAEFKGTLVLPGLTEFLNKNITN